MNSVEDRLADLELRTARIEELLQELRSNLSQPVLHRVRRRASFDPQPAIRAALEERRRTLAVGLKLAGSFVLAALVIWVSASVYENYLRGRPPVNAARIQPR